MTGLEIVIVISSVECYCQLISRSLIRKNRKKSGRNMKVSRIFLRSIKNVFKRHLKIFFKTHFYMPLTIYNFHNSFTFHM